MSVLQAIFACVSLGTDVYEGHGFFRRLMRIHNIFYIRSDVIFCIFLIRNLFKFHTDERFFENVIEIISLERIR